ncbi:hypothetical protein PWG71_22790 [Nocardiopsis sp. N85]|uniref:hypothetical protein n=1 Tax=Nocardiopsis sp. N85 TaxID=3029400 RepID=UPI00237F5E25|nr:hypothetical protein [Nocardiopsis sp. N85]MDE3724227.1 hypothetical protein [Nocardiopsis sp. N85]
MGRLLIKVSAGLVVALLLLWVLSSLVGLLVWWVMAASVIGLAALGIAMVRARRRS